MMNLKQQKQKDRVIHDDNATPAQVTGLSQN